jgi:hypothetical protein
MRKLCILAAAAVVLAMSFARPSAAVLQFYNAFVDQYIKPHPDKKFAEMVIKEAKCLVCHQGKVRKNHNVFGDELKKLLDRTKDTKDTEKMLASFKKVLEMRVDPKNEKSETYGDRLKASKLPAGELAELEKEPKEGEAAK